MKKSISEFILSFKPGKFAETFYFLAAALIWAACVLLLHNLDWPVRSTAASLLAAVFLWVLSPFSLSFTSFMVIVVLVITGAVPLNTGLSGFATGSVFLILAGLMMAEAINETDLARRTAYLVLSRFGGTPGGALAGLFVVLQILAFVVPSGAVRITLLLPTVMAMVDGAGEEKQEKRNITHLFIIGIAFGATITGSGILPAALANIITVDLIEKITGTRILYTQWFLYMFPVSLTLLPVLWYTLMRVFPPEIAVFPGGAEEYRTKLKQMGKLGAREIKCIIILGLTLALWLTEGIHGLHTAVPAMLAVVLFGLPGIGFASWDKMLAINWSTIILVGFTLSLGTVMNDTGTANFFASVFFSHWALKALAPVLIVLLVAVLTQVLHIFLGNVTTVLVALIPVFIEAGLTIGLNPVLVGLVTGVSALFGFLLPVETISNIVVYGTNLLDPFDMLKPGVLLTVAAVIAVTLASYVWWPLLGLFA